MSRREILSERNLRLLDEASEAGLGDLLDAAKLGARKTVGEILLGPLGAIKAARRGAKLGKKLREELRDRQR